MTEQLLSSNHFPSTNWSLVRHAGDRLDVQQSDALQTLLTRYWPALKKHLVRRKHLQESDADDLVQGFIERKVLERNLMATAEPSRGRFRSLLVRSLDNYVANQFERITAKKSAADHALPLDPQDQQKWQHSDAATNDVFDLEWARQVLTEAAERMQQECKASGRQDLWAVFEGRILQPIRDGAEPLSYEEIIQRFQFQSPAQASNALITGKRMFARLLRLVVSQYASDEKEIENEIRDLQRIVSAS